MGLMLQSVVPVHKRWGFRRRVALCFFIVVIRNLMTKIFRVEIEGSENVPPRGTGAIFASNHLSLIDPFYIGVAILNSIRKRKEKHTPLIMTSKKLMDLPHFRWTKYAGAFPVDKDTGKGRARPAIIYSIELVRDGSAVVIFPEGERSRTKRLQKPYPGIGWVVKASGGIVIPTAIVGSEKVMGRGILMPRIKGKVIVAFGKPVDLSRFSDLPSTRETVQQIADEIMIAVRQELQKVWLSRGYRLRNSL